MEYSYQNFLVDRDEDGIATLTVNRQDKLNAMNDEAWEELDDFVQKSAKDPSIRCVILTGAGDKAFVAGADLGTLAAMSPADALNETTPDILMRIERSPKPFIAAVNGFAFGGGCELALACDFRIASENARFGTPETGLGIIPGVGGTQRLARLIGLGRAKDMVMLGVQHDGKEAARIGLATSCVPAEELMGEARKVAHKLLKKGPVALQVAKRVVQLSLSSSEEVGMYAERLAVGALFGTADKKEGTASFLEKRTPQFMGK